MSKFTVKDSGKREEYASGFRRDTQEGKPDYTLLPLEFLTRWAAHMTKGAEKYGRENWRLANDEAALQRFKASAFRHLMQWLDGDRDEDHAAAACFNLAAAEFVLERLETGLPSITGPTAAWAAARRMAGLPPEKPTEARLNAARRAWGLPELPDGIEDKEPPF
jgi:Domain of unknown function (DUF5664)